MKQLTAEMLKKMMPYASSGNISKYLPWFNVYLPLFKIDNVNRLAAFFGQVCHESGSLRYVEEIASGAAYDTGRKAIALGNTPEKDGDGQLYKGRGLIQLTGRNNYKGFNTFLHTDKNFLVEGRAYPNVYEEPQLVATPELAVLSACWFWTINSLNQFADRGADLTITKRINGGTNGLSDRLINTKRAKEVLTSCGY